MEMQDTYVRLDRSIGNLLEMLDQQNRPGKCTRVYHIHGIYRGQESTRFRTAIGFPTGEFYLNRCAALLNMYLMATYGEGKYVETHHNQQIHLNHKLLEEEKTEPGGSAGKSRRISDAVQRSERSLLG